MTLEQKRIALEVRNRKYWSIGEAAKESGAEVLAVASFFIEYDKTRRPAGACNRDRDE